ncbi:hypothetical protein G6F56_009234 [Rhizopus delemar]|nr:hypothetical protein G6F56_009234 [Rhizopus delemar]
MAFWWPRNEIITSPTLNFRAVIELIKEAKCPVVAHNATLDILHTVDQFWEYLPNTLDDCKNLINSMWDNVVDTKYLAQYHPLLQNCFTSTALGSLYNTVSDELKTSGRAVSMAPGFDRYTKDDNKTEHEAGYDAYMTGVIYLALALFIHDGNEEEEGKNKEVEEVENEKVEKEDSETDDDEKEEGEASEEESDDDTEKTMFLSKEIMSYYGKLYLMRCDHPYINLKGEEEILIPHCPNKFFLQNIPSGMTNIGIEKLYPTIQPASVAWLNDSTAWLILKDDTKISLAKLGALGMATVQSFLPGASREVEGKAYGITKDASRIELISHEKWAEVYGPKKAVNYNNLASTLAHVKSESNIPSGGPSFDDIDIPTVNKRGREDELEEKPSKIQKTD